MPRNSDPFEDLIGQWEPVLRQAFLEAVDEIRGRVNISLIAEMLERGEVEGAVRAVGLNPLDFRALDAGIMGAFNSGGPAFSQRIPAIRSPEGTVLHFRFDARDPAAEQWIRDRSSGLITEIIDDQRTTIRNHLHAGLEAGQNPRTTALELMGRRNRVTGQREGGVLGLTSRQEGWQRRYAAELASTDASELRKALERGLRDKRFDRTILKAITSGEPIPAEAQAKMREAYRNKSLKYRADVISRTETLEALSQSQRQAYQQAIANGNVQRNQIKRFWVTAGDERVRHLHRLMPGANKDGVGFDEPFQVPGGGTVMDPPFGPMCRCQVRIRIDHFAGLR